MPLFDVLIICALLLVIVVNGVIEHVRLRRDRTQYGDDAT
jgi:hypothetical protein